MAIVSGDGDLAFICISSHHMINESHNSVGKIPSPCITKVIVKATELDNKKLGQLLQIRVTVIIKKAAITKWGKIYYKLGQVLQIRRLLKIGT